MMISKPKNLSISTQIVAITGVIVLTAASLIGYFSLHASNEILRKDAIASIGAAADYRLQLLVTKLSATRTRTKSILQMSDGICSEGSASMHQCLTGVFEHFAKTTEAAGVQFIPTTGASIQIGMDAANFAPIPLPTGNEIARLGRGVDDQVYVVVRATTEKGEIRAQFPAKQIQSIFADREGLGKSGESFLTDASGYFLTATDYAGPIGHSQPILATPIVRCLQGATGESLGPDFLNVEKVHAFRPIEEIGGGCVMANISETEAFAKSTELVHQIFQVIIVTFIASIILALIASKWLTGPIHKLVKKAKALEMGNYTATPLVNGPREIQAFDQVFSKMTESLLAEISERKQGQVDLSRAIKSRDEFLATLSHELRTPMNIILGWIDILKSEGPNSPLFKQATETLERNAVLQKNLIDDLLDVSRIINGKFPMLKQPVDFGLIISNACEALKPLALKKEIELVCDISTDRVQVSADPIKLTQVVTNFVQNAVKFTNKGGVIKASLQINQNHARFELQDSGIGIEPAFLPHVFDRLKQEDMGTTRVHSGLGLGLAICKHIVDGHDGKLAVHSNGRHQGSTFSVEIPLDHSSFQITPEIKFESYHDQNKKRGAHILIVDDSIDILFLLRTWLEQDGYTVTQAESAREGLKLFQSVKPDVILSDISMPTEDGYQFISRIRNLDDPKNQVPAIALTAYALEEEKNRVMSSGFQLHISKPTSKGIILKAVRSLVGHSHNILISDR